MTLSITAFGINDTQQNNTAIMLSVIVLSLALYLSLG